MPPPPPATRRRRLPLPPMPRKKWTEPEELSLIDKYSQLQSDGSLVRSRTRETKFRPIAAHVNAAHHAADPLAFPFLWTWKDVATKVQNMRHQYLLVKQKLLSAPNGDADPIDWSDGLSLWPNFLRYKEVFGDVPLKPPADPFTADGDLGIGLRFDCCEGEGVDDEEFDYEDAASIPAIDTAPATQRPKRKKRPAWSRLAEELSLLRERDVERRAEAEMEEMERQEAERRRREEELEWEVRMESRRLEWRERIDGMVNHHRMEMESIHGRIIQDQQSVIGQLLGVFSHCPGAGIGIGGHNHHQMMQSLHQMNELVQEENRVDGDGQEDQDQFIVE